MTKSLPPVLSPQLWGNTFWGVMHNFAAAVQHKQTSDSSNQQLRAYFFAFICGIPFILPCLACRDNAPEFFANRLSKVSEKTDLDLFMCDLHNDVNKHLEKPEISHDIAKLRVSDLDLLHIDTCQVWRFIVIIARSTNVQIYKTNHFKNTVTSFANLLGGLGLEDLGLAVKKVLVVGCSMARLFPVYREWHVFHKIQCSETLEDFLKKHNVDELD